MINNKWLFSSLLTFGLTLGLTIFNNISFALTDSDSITMNVNVPNIMELSLASNNINFNDYTGVDEKYSVLALTVNSGLPYNINAKFTSDIQTADLSSKIPFSAVKVEGDFLPIVVSDKNVDIAIATNHINGLNVMHWLGVYLEPNDTIKSGSYNTTIQVEASQV